MKTHKLNTKHGITTQKVIKTYYTTFNNSKEHIEYKSHTGIQTKTKQC